VVDVVHLFRDVPGHIQKSETVGFMGYPVDLDNQIPPVVQATSFVALHGVIVYRDPTSKYASIGGVVE